MHANVLDQEAQRMVAQMATISRRVLSYRQDAQVEDTAEVTVIAGAMKTFLVK